MNKILALAVCVSVAGVSGATILDFDSLSNNEVVTNQFAEATFSTENGFEVRVQNNAVSFGSSVPNFICTATVGGGFTCLEDLNVAFTVAVNNLTFYQVGDNTQGVVGQVDVSHSGGTSTVDILSDADPGTPGLVDLSAYTNVTNILIRDITDNAGLGYDDFSFDPVPEPMTMGLLGLGALVALRRKKRA